MDTGDNFILKIHVQDKELKEVFLNKERRCFTFEDDNCTSDLILPEFKLTSLETLAKHIKSDREDENCFAIYNNGEIFKEYDKDKIKLLIDLVTCIDVKDFLDFIDRSPVNDFYVDTISNLYNNKILEECKRLVSYTTNGMTFHDRENLRILSHDEIIDNKFIKDQFLPIFKDDNDYLGYDFLEKKYARFKDDKAYKFYDSLKDLLEVSETNKEKVEEDIKEKVEEEIEVLDVDDKTNKEQTPEEETFDIFKNETAAVFTPVKKEKLVVPETEEKYEETIKNIDLQFDRLNTQIKKQEEEKYKIDVDRIFNEKPIKLKKQEKPKVEYLFDEEEDKDKDKYKIDIEKIFNKKPIKLKKKEKSEVEYLFDEDKEKNDYKIDIDDIFDKYQLFVKENKKKKNDYKIDVNKILKEKPIKIKERKKKELPKYKIDLDNIFDNHDVKFKIKSSENIKHEKNHDDSTKDSKYKVDISNIFADKEFVLKNQILSNEAIKNVKKEVNKALIELEKEEVDALDLTKMLEMGIEQTNLNYRINFNETQKLVIEHLPYYVENDSLDVIEIPEIEKDKLDVIPGEELNFGRIKFKVKELNKTSVILKVLKATSIVDDKENRIKEKDEIKITKDKELNLLLNKKNAMETWKFSLEKTTFTKELRHIEYQKLFNLIKKNIKFNKLTKIEQYELQKSLMLFVYFAMKNKDEDIINKVSKTIVKDTESYEEMITSYNIDNSILDKDNLVSYEYKREFLEHLSYIKGLVDKKVINYPRYIFGYFDYFEKDEIMEDFIEELNKELDDRDFSNYLIKAFAKNNLFNNLDKVGNENLLECLNYLSKLYKANPVIGENDKYEIESTLFNGTTEEDMSLLISKLCRRGIKDYDTFKEYDDQMKEAYRTGNLKYPLYSKYFEIEDSREGGDYYE